MNDTPVGTTGVNQQQSIVSHWEGTIAPDPLSQSGEIAPNAASNNTLSFDLTYNANGVPNQLTYEMSAIHATINGEGDFVCYNGWPAGWGQGSSAESEADIGTDADPTNNLIPTSDTADQDGADDGVALPIPISHCVSSPVQFAVTIPENAPPGVEWKVNVWFDWNRDGKWGDVLNCVSEQAPEWAVQNLMLGELDPAYHFFYTPFLPYNADPSQPIWMRITLSDDSAISADGSGPDTDYDYGETEDYYLLASDLQPWSSSEIAPGTTYDLTFNQMGNYPYHVQQRPVVKGGIFVRPAAATQLQRPAVTVEVRITDTGLVPLVTTIAVGDTVRWHNDTTMSHTLVGDVLVIATGMERIYLPLVLR